MSYADAALLDWLGDTRRGQLSNLQYDALVWAYHVAVLTYPSAAWPRRLVELASEAALYTVQGKRARPKAATVAEHDAVELGRRVARMAMKELSQTA